MTEVAKLNFLAVTDDTDLPAFAGEVEKATLDTLDHAQQVGGYVGRVDGVAYEKGAKGYRDETQNLRNESEIFRNESAQSEAFSAASAALVAPTAIHDKVATFADLPAATNTSRLYWVLEEGIAYQDTGDWTYRGVLARQAASSKAAAAARHGGPGAVLDIDTENEAFHWRDAGVPNGITVLAAAGGGVWEREWDGRHVLSRWADDGVSGPDLDATLAVVPAGGKLTINKRAGGAQHVRSAEWIIDRACEVEFEDGAFLGAEAGYPANRLLWIKSSNVKLYNVQIDGANLPPPGATYNGAFEMEGVGLKVSPGLGTEEQVTEDLVGVVIRGGTIRNTRMSAIFVEDASDTLIEDVTFIDCCSDAVHVPPGAVYIVGRNLQRTLADGVWGHNNVIRNCRCYRSGTKAFAIWYTEGAEISGCYVEDGHDGHAAFYLRQVNGGLVHGNYVWGRTAKCFGTKISRNTQNITVSGNRYRNVTCGTFIQGTRGFNVIGEECIDPGKWGGIWINPHSDSPYDCEDGNVIGCSVRWIHDTVVAGDITLKGIHLEARQTGPLRRIRVSNCTVDGAYFGILMTGYGAASDIVIEANTITNSYDVPINCFAWDRLVIDRNIVEGTVTSDEAIQVISSPDPSFVQADYVKITNNTVRGYPTYGIRPHENLKVRRLEIAGNYVEGGVTPIIYYRSAIERLILAGNTCIGGSGTSGLTISPDPDGAGIYAEIYDNRVYAKNINFAVEAKLLGGLYRNNLCLNYLTDSVSTKLPKALSETIFVGDEDVTITAEMAARRIIFDAPLTADRSLYLPLNGYGSGYTVKVRRTSAATGAFSIYVRQSSSIKHTMSVPEETLEVQGDLTGDWRIVSQRKQAAAQADSAAADVSGVVADLNALLAKLRAAGLMAQ